MPVAPQILSVTDDVSPQAGLVTYGTYTNDSSPVVRVSLGDQAAAGQTLTLSEIESPLTNSITLTADQVAQGFADITAAGLPEGWNQLQATLRSVAGETLGSSSYIAIGVATAAPAAPVFSLVQDDSGAVPLAVPDGGHTLDATPLFQIHEAGVPGPPPNPPGHAPYYGVALFGGHIELFENGQLLADATISFNGDVTLTSGGLSAGEHTLVAVAVDRAGNVSAPSAAFHLTIDAAAADGGGTAPVAVSQGTDGDDLLQATASAPLVEGGPGNDTIQGAGVADLLRGGLGEDSITGGTQVNIINGNQGADSIIGRSTIGDVLMGGQGNDLIDASQATGHNLVNGNIGADSITGGAGGDFLRGGQGDDVIVGGANADWLSGDRGVNALTGGGGADLFHYGGGTDRVLDFSQVQGDRVVIDPGAQFTAAQVGADTVIDVTGQGQMILVGVQYASLTSGWLVQP